jgi:Fic family protein
MTFDSSALALPPLYPGFAAPLSHAMLFEWHQMLANGRRDLHDIGRYRTHPEPMQIVSGAVHAPKVHFETPPSSEMIPEMDRFIAWFNDTAPEGKNRCRLYCAPAWPISYFVSIHPFEDGNGRIGRVLAEKYNHITDATRATATRDLQDLVGKARSASLLSTGETTRIRRLS